MPTAEYWTNGSWSLQSPANHAGAASSQLLGISCATGNRCLAVGDYTNAAGRGFTLAGEWDGTIWTGDSSASPSSSYNQLNGVTCPERGFCLAVGYGNAGANSYPLVEVRKNGIWDRRSTARPPAGASSELWAASCANRHACTAVGDYRTKQGFQFPWAEGWNGSTWRVGEVQKPPGGSGTLSAVSCPSVNACTAVGNYVSPNGDQKALVERWTGSSWRLQTTPSTGTAVAVLAGVSCSAAASCTAVGNTQTSTALAPLAERWDGSSWRIQSTARPFSAGVALLRAVSCPSSGLCLAVGESGPASSVRTLAERWSDGGWTVEKSANPSGASFSQLYGVSCASASSCLAAGQFGSNGQNLTLSERRVS